MKVSISYYKNKDNQKPDEYTGDCLQDIFIRILDNLGYKVEVETKGPICPLCQIGLVLDKHVGNTSEFKCPMCINEVKKIVIIYR